MTSASGFLAGAVHAGLKSESELDLAILFSEAPCNTAGVFTTNRIKSAPIILTQRHLSTESNVQAIVANSGCANAYVGEQGLKDALDMANLTAAKLGISPQEVLVASTGVTGVPMPMTCIRAGIDRIRPHKDGGYDFARAIMTTDTVPKEVAVRADGFIIGGIIKGSGMIHPSMATMLCFLTTDAAVEADFLRLALSKAVDVSFNMVSIDGDTSPSDTVLMMANGLAGGEPISQGSERADIFQQALEEVCIYLAKAIAHDGEGATRLIEVTVNGAPSIAEARLAARTVVSSPLVKAAVHGSDPNWGRIMAAVGRSGVGVVESKIDLYIGDICLVKEGRPLPFSKRSVVRVLEDSEVPITLNLNLGTATATAWGCDLSEEYVTINSQYTT